MATVNKPILLDETGKDMAAAIREQTEILSRATITMNPADYIVDCEYNEGEVEITKINEAGETVTETITVVTSWYERYASGWVRQGGTECDLDETGYYYTKQVSLSVPMKTNIYKVTASTISFDDLQEISMACDIFPTETTSLTVGSVHNTLRAENSMLVLWTVEGMGAKL